MQNPKHHIIIADSQYLIVESLRLLIESDEKLFLRGIAGTRKELFKIVENTTQPALIITDYNLFDYNGIDDFKTMQGLNKALAVLILTNQVGKAEIIEFTKAGIKNSRNWTRSWIRMSSGN